MNNAHSFLSSMKMKHLVLLFLFVYGFSRAQENFELYGFLPERFGIDPGLSLVRLDPKTGKILSKVHWQNSLSGTVGTMTADYKNKLIYDLVTDPLNMYIIRRHLITGAFVDTIFKLDSIGPGKPGWSSDEITGFFYNCYDGYIYFFYNTQNNKIEKLDADVRGTRVARMDPGTGKVNVLTILPGYYFMNHQYCDAVHQKIFFSEKVGAKVINSYDLRTREYSTIFLSRKYSANQLVQVAFNPNDNQLYGVEVEIRGKSKIIRIDPKSGMVTDLTGPLTYDLTGNFCFSKSMNKLYFCAMDHLLSFDIKSGTLTVYPPQNSPGPEGYIDLWSIQADAPDTTFKAKNFCQGIPTEFIPATYNGVIKWDFGDPVSGISDTSNLISPFHVYTNPGTYEVTMTSTTCTSTNTIKKKITIEPFQKIDLGSDITWCEGNKNSELQVELTTPNATYLWQDQSTNPFYTIREPGNYWVKVSSSCGDVSDSITVKSMECPCPVTVAPTYTGDFFSVTLDCEPSYYSTTPLIVELFDMLGRLMVHKEITESNTSVSMEQFRTGAYFYRVRTKNEILSSGKLIYIDH